MQTCGCSPVPKRSAALAHTLANLLSQEPLARVQRSTVNIPGGRSLLGTNRPVLEADGEGPLRTTKVKPFRIDPTAVTNARFEDFVAATGYETDAEKLGSSFVFQNFLPAAKRNRPRVAAAPWWCEVQGACWRDPFGPGSADLREPEHPVVHISWHDACAFALWAGGRLPGEAEWEHAARGGLQDVRFPWGDEEPDDTGYFPCNIWQGKFPDKDLALDGFAGLAPAPVICTERLWPLQHGRQHMGMDLGTVQGPIAEEVRPGRSGRHARLQAGQGRFVFVPCKLLLPLQDCGAQWHVAGQFHVAHRFSPCLRHGLDGQERHVVSPITRSNGNSRTLGIAWPTSKLRIVRAAVRPTLWRGKSMVVSF